MDDTRNTSRRVHFAHCRIHCRAQLRRPLPVTKATVVHSAQGRLHVSTHQVGAATGNVSTMSNEHVPTWTASVYTVHVKMCVHTRVKHRGNIWLNFLGQDNLKVEN